MVYIREIQEILRQSIKLMNEELETTL